MISNALVKQGDKASLSNILNEMFYEEKMTLQELRFFLVYLSRINPKNPDKTVVEFPLEEYAQLLGVELNEQKILSVTRKLLRYVVCIRPKVLDDDIVEAYNFCQLFSESMMYRRRSDDRWFLKFECHPKVKEHLFDLKAEYTSLEVWNIVNLGNFQDARMYMLLKQYRTIGERVIDLKELKKMLGIDVDAYPEYKIFARAVLKKCQQSLKERTDLCFDFKSVGRPAHAVRFEIHSNTEYTPPAFLDPAKDAKQIDGQMDLEDYLEGEAVELTAEELEEDGVIPYMALEELGLTHAQKQDLVTAAYDKCPWLGNHAEREDRTFAYIRNKVNLMKAQRRPVAKAAQYKWLRSAIMEDWK